MSHDDAGGSHTADGFLFAQIAAGDDDALAALVRRFSQRVKAAAYRILSDEGEAEEIVQEVAWRVWQRASDYDQRLGSAATWILTLTERRAIDRLRQRRSRQRAEARQHRREACPPAILERELFPSCLLRVRKAFRELPPTQRQVLGLAVFRGMSQSEIAAAVGIPLGTVKTRTNSAKRKLRQSLTGMKPG
jgi:RNA polymerase sigma-70 factor (ECF subfamily)